MTYHKIVAGFIILFVLAACNNGNRLMQRLVPPTHAEQMPAPAPPPPPPSPKAAQDQVSLPPEARSLSDTVLPPVNTGITVALLLPLTGPYASLGKDLQNAAELALFDVKNTELKLLPLDTKSTPEGAVAAMNKAIAAHASIVLGPLFSQEAASIIPIVRTQQVPIVSFSNNVELANDGIFVFGFMPQQQIRRVLEFSLRKGIHDYYAILPNDALGNATLRTMQLFQDRGDFNLHVTEQYNPATNQGIVDAVRNVAKHIQAAKKEQRTRTQRALLIPEGGSKLLEISKLLAGFGLNANDVRLIGSGQWDDGSLGKYKRLYGGWFATASPAQRDIFEKHFQQTYRYRPIRIASIAYDAVALVGFLSQQSGNSLSTTAIINERGFSGVDGVFRFTPDRISERSLAILEVIPNGFEVVDEAPKVLKSFSGE